MPQEKSKKTQNKEQDMMAELTTLRQAIDGLDDSIIDLLFHRTKIVEKVGELKTRHNTGKSYIRPGREALLVRRIATKFKDSRFAPQAAAGIWRAIISASTAIESSFKVSVFMPQGDTSMYWLAREYFGAFTPTLKQPTLNRVLGDVVDGKAVVGILPYPSVDDVSNWWQLLASKEENWPKIFAHVPFMAEKSGPRALAIGHVAPEPTGDDKTCLLLEVDDNTSTARINAALSKAGLKASWVLPPQVSSGKRQHFMEIDGFITPEHPGFKKLLSEMGESIISYYNLGAYATPLSL